jgi:hypothetical protein
MKKLTKINQLDLRFPGLADQVRNCFDLGMTSQQVAQLLREQYEVSVPRWAVGYFRTRYWARPREREEARRIEATATAAFNRLQEMKAASGAGFRGVEN